MCVIQTGCYSGWDAGWAKWHLNVCVIQTGCYSGWDAGWAKWHLNVCVCHIDWLLWWLGYRLGKAAFECVCVSYRLVVIVAGIQAGQSGI